MREKPPNESRRNMAYKVELSQNAEQHLDDIVAYIRIRLANPAAARSIYADFIAALDVLSKDAACFALVSDIALAEKGYRKYPLEHHDYLLIYKIQNDEVEIVGIFHMMQNYINKL